jgi:hypothetical protein
MSIHYHASVDSVTDWDKPLIATANSCGWNVYKRPYDCSPVSSDEWSNTTWRGSTGHDRIAENS